MQSLAGRLDDYPPELVERIQERLRRLPEAAEDFRPQSAASRERRAQFRRLRLDLIAAQREELITIRDLGTYPSGMLDAALAQLDAEQLGLELHRG